VPAGFWVRLVAFVLDYFISALAMVVLVAGLGFLGAMNGVDFKDQQSPLFMAFFLVSMAVSLVAGFMYYGWFNKNKGGTPGKLIMGLRVEHIESGENLGYGRTLARLFMFGLSMAVTLYLGVFVIGLRKDKRGLHDLIAGTICVVKQKN
jgi:uncharacterized RDD family membrane protein YckC